MEATLKPEEACLLERILNEYLSNLRAEMAGTERYELRQELHKEEEILKGLLERLDRSAATKV
jgi:hypothetical protein